MTLVDCDVLIAHLRGLDAVRDWLRRARSDGRPLAISVVSIVEITGGMRTDERPAVWRLLRVFEAEAVTESVARRAGELMRRYRRSHPGVGLADYVIAATADVSGLGLATLNVRHFPMFRGLRPAFRVPL